MSVDHSLGHLVVNSLHHYLESLCSVYVPLIFYKARINNVSVRLSDPIKYFAGDLLDSDRDNLLNVNALV